MKFVSLHNHTTFSIGDGFSYPEDHFNFVVQNAGNESMALAITDHGNVNALGYIIQAQNSLKKKGIDFHAIIGNEMYIHPDLEQWKIDKENAKLLEEEDDGAVVEVEAESKSKSKWYDPVKRRHHLVVIATNSTGIKNLFALTSWSYKNGFYRYPRVDFKQLEKYNEGLIISSACLAGLGSWVILRDQERGEEVVQKSLDNEFKPLLDIFGRERSFVEIQFNKLPEQKIVNEQLIKFAQRHNFQIIATADAHYANPNFWLDREMYKMIALQTKKFKVSPDDLPKTREDLKCELYPKNGDEMYESYLKYNPELDPDIVKNAITLTYDIAHNMIEKYKPDGSFKLPIRDFKHQTPEEKFQELCWNALISMKLDNNNLYIDRLKKELKVITSKGFAPYFLTLQESINEIEKQVLLGPGRGSAASSLCSYLLGITKIDPIRCNLIFERFLSENRSEAPDSDQDCEDRDKVLNILREHFGVDTIVAISNFNKYQLKSLVKDISNFYKIPFQEVNTVTSIMEQEARTKLLEEINWDQKFYEFTFEGAMKHSPTFKAYIEKYPIVGERIGNIFKQIKSIGKHAGGCAIVDSPDINMPIIKIRGELQTPWSEGLTAKHLEQFGIIKYDFLGLATLRMIKKAISFILERRGEVPTHENVMKFYNNHLAPEVVGEGELDVFKEIYHKGKFLSIFQFAERNVQEFCKAAKPKSVSDISDITAIYRPGPLASGSDKKYIEAIEDPKSIKFEHPILEKLLKKRKGQIIYQEDFMFIAHELAGFTLLEADELRKLLMKPVQSMSDEMKKKRIEAGERFINGCIKAGMNYKEAEYLWEDRILPFVSYGFVKSLHSDEKITIFSDSGEKINDLKIEQIKPGMIVKSRDDLSGKDIFICVKNKHDHGIIDLFEIETEDGRRVKCTLDHKFKVEDGGMLPVWKIMKENLNIVTLDTGDPLPKIKSATYIGKHQTYDLEVDHPDHQFYLANGLLTSNSHAISYSYNSYACSWLFHYYPIEWVAAVLENESQGKPEEKQRAISLVKSFGYNVIMPDINKSSSEWQIIDDKTVVAPLNFIQSVGQTAVPYLVSNQPYSKLEDLIFNEKIDYRKVNKRVLSSLSLSGALTSLIDERFENDAQFHEIAAENRPKTLKKFSEMLETTKGQFQPFSNEQIFLEKSRLLGFLDIDLLIPKDLQEILEEKNTPSISDFDIDIHKFCWVYINSAEPKTSKAGNDYIRLKVFGVNFDEHEIYLFGSTIDKISANKCAILQISKSIGQAKWCVYSGNIRVI